MAPGSVCYPKYRDISAEESVKLLRQLELEAYAAVISALRSQGDLSKEKRTLLSEISACLGITEDRHKAEIRRAVNDETLATIALHCAGRDCEVEWLKEGRRTLRLLHRPLQITNYMQQADRIAEIIAAENEVISEPTKVDLDKLTNRSIRKQDPPKKPPEETDQCGMRLYSSLYCVKCLSKQNELVDAGTSTDDLVTKKKEFDPATAPDDCIHLPSGTVVRVSSMTIEKDETDAYSYDSNPSGNYDFGCAPEISLTDSKGNKRKRKKSSGYVPPKEGVVTIRQVIRPSSDEKPSKPTKHTSIPPKRQQPESHKKDPVKPVIKRDNKPKNPVADDISDRPAETMPKKKKKSSPQTSAIQHTPVPPEHLYAVGGGTVPRSQQSMQGFPGDNNTCAPQISKPDFIVSTEHSPTKHLAMQSNRQVFSPTYSTTFSHSAWQVPRESMNEPTSHGFRYSPTKSTYRPQKIGPSPLVGKSPKSSHMKRHRMSPYSLTKRHTDEYEGQRTLKRTATKNDGPEKYSDDAPGPHKMFRPTFNRSMSGHYLPTDVKLETPVPMPEVQSCQDVATSPATHSSALDELASVSLLASGLSATTMVETGLAPVSAIVSRVTSPAPGQVSSSSSVKKSVSVPLVVSRIHGEEGSLQMQKIVHNQPTTDVAMSIAPPRQLSVVASGPLATTKLKIQGSTTPSNAITQVRLAVPSSDITTVGSVPISFTSSLPHAAPALNPQLPRVISTIAGKSSTILKSSSGNVITVTAKPITAAVRASVPTIVSGASIVKPQIGPKTSIIVVHKAAAGSMIAKTVPANFPSLGSEGSKVITVSTKNITTTPVEIPKYTPENTEESISESALGSIQGLVSGLPPAAVDKNSKLFGMKPKFITMPINKKPIKGKICGVRKSKIIQNIIKAPGKVLVKTTGTSTLSSVQLKTIPTAKIVKPVELQAAPSHDIVAAALSQSLGATIVSTNEAPPPIPSESSTFAKVTTSTPAASTIKAIAASYQKNTSSGQHIQTQIVPSSSFHLPEKPKVVLASPNQTPAMLFTPNQPQVHRSPQSGSQRPKSNFQPTLTKSIVQTATTANTQLTSVFKSNQERLPISTASQSTLVQLEMLADPLPKQALLHSTIAKDQSTSQIECPAEDVTPSTGAVSTGLTAKDQQSAPSIGTATVSSDDKATFIYQYRTTSLSTHGVDSPAVMSASGTTTPAALLSTNADSPVITRQATPNLPPAYEGGRFKDPQRLPAGENVPQMDVAVDAGDVTSVEGQRTEGDQL